MSGTSQLAVARAVVQPTSTTITVCILNTSDEPATLYAGAVIAVLEPVEPPAEVDAVSDTHPEVSDDKREMLWQLVQDCGAELSAGERDIFYDLLLTYSDVMASSTADLGRTDRLRHHIDTGDSPPVRQPVRRISPHRREEVKELFNQMLERGVVEPSSSPWASPRGKSRKLHRPWTGPFRVLKRLSESGYRLQHVQAPRKRVVVHFDRLKPCYPGTRQPEMREQCPRRPPQSTPEVPVGTGLELVDEDSGATSPPTFARPEAPSGGESPAPAAPTSPGATATSPHPSTTPTTSPASSPPSSPLPSTTPITSPVPSQPLPSPPIEQPRRRYPQRARAPPTRL